MTSGLSGLRRRVAHAGVGQPTDKADTLLAKSRRLQVLHPMRTREICVTEHRQKRR